MGTHIVVGYAPKSTAQRGGGSRDALASRLSRCTAGLSLYTGRTVLGMKINKTWGIVAAAPLAVISFIVSIKLGIVIVIALLILAHLLRGPSKSGGVISVGHANPPGQRLPRRNGGGIQTFFPPRRWKMRRGGCRSETADAAAWPPQEDWCGRSAAGSINHT